MNEFSHYSGCRLRDPDNCSGCALTMGGKEGPNYAGWPISYLKNGRSIPAKWQDALKKELASDNRAYSENLKRIITEIGSESLKAIVKGE